MLQVFFDLMVHRMRMLLFVVDVVKHCRIFVCCGSFLLILQCKNFKYMDYEQ